MDDVAVGTGELALVDAGGKTFEVAVSSLMWGVSFLADRRSAGGLADLGLHAVLDAVVRSL